MQWLKSNKKYVLLIFMAKSIYSNYFIKSVISLAHFFLKKARQNMTFNFVIDNSCFLFLYNKIVQAIVGHLQYAADTNLLYTRAFNRDSNRLAVLNERKRNHYNSVGFFCKNKWFYIIYFVVIAVCFLYFYYFRKYLR